MTKTIRQAIIRLSVLSLLFASVFAPGAVSAATQTDSPALQGSLCGGAENLQISEGVGDCDDPEAEENVDSIITSVINIFSAVVGVVAVIMILFGGFKYITAGGDSSKIQSAQHTIIYAIVGLVIVALAQIIVRFVLFRSALAGE